ncbi:Poly(A) RNA polymerase protein 2 [Cytospora mali]|uniref:polynucleotide adenylyltransferase n=1 Tax=Cytospora mali TaxID=578113 RepID=A0A194UMM7_CYTMA|nr:Poly(A) RNA polymerase protein 2 [Valsa mali var. pyri (nom. inval.)]
MIVTTATTVATVVTVATVILATTATAVIAINPRVVTTTTPIQRGPRDRSWSFAVLIRPDRLRATLISALISQTASATLTPAIVLLIPDLETILAVPQGVSIKTAQRDPSDRAILHTTDNNKPTEDFAADTGNGVTYRSIDQLSDSDEAEMDMSDSDDEPGQPTTKRARTIANKIDDGDDAPKWSNPDPYTALPPVDDTDKKRKDVVQLIRKARMQPAGGSRTALPVDDEDFIRCDTPSEEEGEEDEEEFIDPLTYKRGSSGAQGAPGAPTGPRAAGTPQPVTAATPGQVAASTAQPTPATNNIEKRVASADMTKSSDLGSRKRTYDDVLKLPSHARLKPPPGRPAGGSLVGEWWPKKNENPCPWVTVPNTEARTNVRFNLEIRDFYDHVRPREFEDRLRGNLVEDLNRILERSGRWNGRKFHPFGSFMSGLYLPTGDMDLVLCSNAILNGGAPMLVGRNQLNSLKKDLQNNRVAVENRFEMITKARVPLVKYVDKTTGLKIDISFENVGGILAIQTFKAWREQYPVMPILVTIIKQYLLMRGLNEPVNGGIGGFSVICMVVSMLQMMPQINSGDMIPEHHLGTLLMHFFDLYGNRFDHKTTALRLNPPGYVNKNQVTTFTYKNPGRLSIIDPNNPGNDISGGSMNYQQIVASFSQAYKLLQERLSRIAKGENFKSILEVILGGNYSTFREQRNYLRQVHENRFGYCDE